MLKVKDQEQHEHILDVLDICIAHWATIVKRGADRPKIHPFTYGGEEYFPMHWVNSCVLCDEFGPSSHPCENCPMSGEWSGGRTCHNEESSFQKFCSAEEPDFRLRATGVLLDLIHAKRKYENAVIEEKEEFVYFRLRPIPELLAMGGMVPYFDGTKVKCIGDEIIRRTITPKMLYRIDKDLRYFRVPLERWKRMCVDSIHGEGPDEDELYYRRWVEQVAEPPHDSDYLFCIDFNKEED